MAVTGKIWTREEDEYLINLMRTHLGARFTDIADIATGEEGEIKYRTHTAVAQRLSIITGRTTPRSEKGRRNEQIEALQNIIDALNAENAELKARNATLNSELNKKDAEIRKLKNSNEALAQKSIDFSRSVINCIKNIKTMADTYAPFFQPTQEDNK